MSSGLAIIPFLVLGAPQSVKSKISTPQLVPYKASKLTAETIAKQVGATIKKMKGVDGHFLSEMTTSEGKSTISGVIRVADSKHYRIDYVSQVKVPFSCTFTADGQRRFVRTGDKLLPPMLVNQQLAVARIAPKSYPNTFFLDFSRMMYQGLTEGIDAFSPMIAGFRQNGFTLKVQERKVVHLGKTYINYKISGSREKDPTGKYNKAGFEIVVDGTWWLPVTVTTKWIDKDKKPWNAQWSAGYAFGKTFTKDELSMKN